MSQENKGWECPVCGNGIAPWIKSCDCKQTSLSDQWEQYSKQFDPWPNYQKPGTWTGDPIWQIDLNGITY